MKDIPMYNTFAIIQLINKGMAGDTKYYVKDNNGKEYLLRIADVSEYEQKKSEFNRLKMFSTLNIPITSPIDFGLCNKAKSVYTLLSWVKGVEVETIIPTLSDKEQYDIGIKSGMLLRKLHSFSAPKEIDDWYKRYFNIIEERIDAFKKEGVKFEGNNFILDFIYENKHLLKDRPQCYHHSDYHMGNLILSEDNEVHAIDWHTVDFDNIGDPWYEFNRIGVEFPCFASGQINGYFNNNIPNEFWKLLALYLSASAITSVVWAKYFAPDRLEAIISLNKDILSWFNNMNTYIPVWYKSL